MNLKKFVNNRNGIQGSFCLWDSGKILEEIKDETGKEATADYIEMVKEYGKETQVNVKFMRKMFPDNLVLKSDGEFLYLPIDETMEKNSYDYSRLEQVDKFFEYKDV